MRPFRCPSYTHSKVHAHARTHAPPMPPAFSHQRPLLLPLQPTGAKDQRMKWTFPFFLLKRGKVEKFMRRVWKEEVLR